MSEPPAESSLRWYQIDQARFEHESRRLKPPWRLERQSDGRYAWIGGEISKTRAGRHTELRPARLIYPTGFPARFIEARIEPDPPSEFWGAYGTHVNADGSACYVNADGWSPQDTVQKALELFETWWWNYYWIVEKKVDVAWPPRGAVTF